MKKYSLALVYPAVFVLIAIGFGSCKKINEPTELGGNLIPGVDNVHTFEVSLNSFTNNLQFNDSTKLTFSDLVAVGDLNDPEFGQTHGNANFNISPSTVGTYPFGDKSTLTIDSVVLSLSYQGGYGDTTNGVQTLRVYEIAPNSGFRSDSIYYKYSDPSSDFATTGAQLGSATVNISHLKDSMTVISNGHDTAKVANVVRIKIDNSLGYRFAQYDTADVANGGFHSDTNFIRLFKGLAVKEDAGGNVLSYFNLTDVAKTNLTVYYRNVANGAADTSSFSFIHAVNGQSNYIKMTPGGGWQAALNNGTDADDKIYLQSAPSGSYASILIPSLDTFKNKVIHRAEIIAPRITSPLEDIFYPPTRLLLDRTNKGATDTAFILQNDLVADASGSINFYSFGGTLLSDNTYKFNISRYVQSIVTTHQPNDTLRLYAPLRSTLWNENLKSYISVPVSSKIANGRVELAGGSFADPNSRLRLRIVYSDL